MTGNTKSLPDPYLEASSWFMKVEEGLSDLERRQFEAWIAASDAHPEIFAKVCAISSADLADMDAGQQADISVAPVARARTTSYWRNLALPAAAAVVLVAFVSAGLLFQPSSDRATGVEMAAVQISTQIDKLPRQAKLSDGSVLWVDAASSVKVDFGPEQRLIQLEHGGLYVSVVSMPDLPLTISSPDFTATAIGTAFEVQTHGPAPMVSVSEGVVEVADKTTDQVFRISRGMRATRTGEGEWVETPVPLVDIGTWRDNGLIFRMRPLSEVVDSLNRYRSERLIRVDPEIADMEVSGGFSLKQSDAAEVDRALALAAGAVTSSLENGDVLIAPAEPLIPSDE